MKNLSNWITDYIKTGNNSGLKMFLGWNMFIYGFLIWFYLFFKVFIYIHKYANKMIYISDHMKKTCV